MPQCPLVVVHAIMETVTATTLSQKFNVAWDGFSLTEVTDLLSEVENTSLDDIENFLINVMKKTSDVKCRSPASKTKRTLLWSLIFQKKLQRKIFNRCKSFVGLLVQYGNINVLMQLFYDASKPNLRDTGSDGNTLLHHLCENKWVASKSKTALYSHCMQRVLENMEVDVNAYNSARKTAMDLAIGKGNKDAIKFLIENCAILCYPKAVHHSVLEKIKLLLPDVKLPDEQLTDQGLFLPKLHYELMRKNVGYFVADFLTYSPKYPKLFNDRLLTILLQEACKGGLEEPVQLLLDSGANPYKVDEYNDGRSAIMVAAELNHFRILDILDKTGESFLGQNDGNVVTVVEKPLIQKVDETFKRKNTDDTTTATVSKKSSSVEAASTNSGSRVVIIPIEYPDKEMSNDEATVIETNLISKISSEEAMEEKLQFQDTEYDELKGYLKITCGNEVSRKFIQNSLAEDNKYKVVDMKDVPQRNRIVIELSQKEQQKTIFKCLEKQNQGLSCAKWSALPGRFTGKLYQLGVAIDSESLRFLRQNEWKFFYGLKRVDARKLTDKEWKKLEAAAADEDEDDNVSVPTTV